MARGDKGLVIFRNELPVPTVNLSIYEQIYVLEQWYRRIAFASLVATSGTEWRGLLPSDLWGDLRRRLKQLDRRVHLHSDTSQNAIWLLTLDELRAVLALDALRATVSHLTGTSTSVLESKLDELREVRNIVGHNRPTTPATHAIVSGIEAGLRPGIDRFRTSLLYDYSDRYVDESAPDGPAEAAYVLLVRGNDWKRCQPVLTTGEFFHTLTWLPVEPYWNLAVKHYLELTAPVTRNLLATQLNRNGSEFSVVWSRKAAPGVHEEIVRWFFTSRDEFRWTETPYELQSPSAICDPLIWFYENEQPLVE